MRDNQRLNLRRDLANFVQLYFTPNSYRRKTMKRASVAVLLCAFAFSPSFAQEEPIPPKRSKSAKIGGLGGFTPGWLFVDVKEINNFLQAGKGAPLKDNGVFLTGGGGAAYIMVVPNLRVGGMGMGGSISSSSLDASGLRRDAELHVGFGGVTFEYAVSLMEHFDVAFGTMLGTGGIDITLRQNSGGQSTWTGEQGFLGGTGNVSNNTRKLSGSFFIFAPSLNFEYSVLSWVGIRLGATYVGMAAPSWKVDGEYELLGVPSKVSGRGFMINAGLFVGTF